jgi:hypothetical protein
VKPNLARKCPPEVAEEEAIEDLLSLLLEGVASGPEDATMGNFTRFARALRASFRRELESVEGQGPGAADEMRLLLSEQGPIRELLAAAERALAAGKRTHARWDLRELQAALSLHRRRGNGSGL